MPATTNKHKVEKMFLNATALVTHNNASTPCYCKPRQQLRHTSSVIKKDQTVPVKNQKI